MATKHTTVDKKTGVATRDLSDLLKPYESGWVALSSDEQQVVGAGQTLHDARQKAHDRGVENAVFVKIIPPRQGYLPIFL